MDLRGDYEGKEPQYTLRTRVRDLSAMGYCLDLSCPHGLESQRDRKHNR